ncbi:MAG: hypothetical protein JO069_09180 [Verrucomicrobia bacterium]|nr:hypothetical protein [Verrucomicrobiota bacterium]
MDTRALASLFLTWWILGATCWGDGGAIQFSGVNHGLQISVFTDPGIPSAGPVDLSVLVQEAGTHAALLDAEVQANLKPERLTGANASAVGSLPWSPPICAATGDANLQSFALSHDLARNRLYYAALVQIPSAGRWHLSLHVRRGDQKAFVEGTLDVGNQGAPWTNYWHLFLFPLVAVGFFAAVQRQRTMSHEAKPEIGQR